MSLELSLIHLVLYIHPVRQGHYSHDEWGIRRISLSISYLAPWSVDNVCNWPKAACRAAQIFLS